MNPDVEQCVKSFVLSCYGFVPLDITPISQGVASINYHVVGPSGHLLVRCEMLRPKKDLCIDLIHMGKARENHVSVPPGPFSVYSECGLSLLARPYIFGRTLSEDCFASRSIWKEAGRQLALIHRASVDTTRNYFYAFLINPESDEWSFVVEYSLRNKDPIIRGYAHSLIEELRTVSESFAGRFERDYCLTHGDFKPQNLIVTENCELVVLDWDKSCRAPRILDLGLAVFHALCYDMNKVNFGAAMSLLKGYLSSAAHLGEYSSSDIWKAVASSAKAWFLRDIARVTQSSMLERTAEYGRRNRYFSMYCRPCYELFVEHEKEIRSMTIEMVARLSR